MDQVFAAFLDPTNIFALVFFGHRQTRPWNRSAAVTLERTDGGNNNRAMWSEAGKAAFQVPEFLKADVCTEAGLGDVIVTQLQGHTVGDDRGLTDCDVGKRACVHEHGLPLD